MTLKRNNTQTHTHIKCLIINYYIDVEFTSHSTKNVITKEKGKFILTAN